MCILGGLYVVTFQSAVIKTEALTHLHMNQMKRRPQITSRADLERTTRFFCEMCILGGLYVVTFQSAVIKTEAFFLTHLHMNQTKRSPQITSRADSECSTFQMLLPPVGIRQSSDCFSCIWYQFSSPGHRSATDETCSSKTRPAQW